MRVRPSRSSRVVTHPRTASSAIVTIITLADIQTVQMVAPIYGPILEPV